MRYVVYVAGGIGGTIGARLFQHGQDVVLIARGAHLEVLKAQGLRLRAPGEDVRLPIGTCAPVRHPFPGWRRRDPLRQITAHRGGARRSA